MQNYKKTESPEKLVFVTKLETVPGGGTVAVIGLGGSRVYAGAPLRVASGLYKVIKTAKVHVNAASSATSIEVAKGSLFKAGDKIGKDGAYGNTISAIDRDGSTSYDTITLSAALGAALVAGDTLEEVVITSAPHSATVQGAHSTTTDTSIKVDKGHSLVVGDIIAGTGADPMTGKTITNIDRGADGYDTITVSAEIGKALADNEVVKTVTAVSGTTLKNKDSYAGYSPMGYLGESFDIESSNNHLQSVVIRGTITESNLACPLSVRMKSATPLVRFV